MNALRRFSFILSVSRILLLSLSPVKNTQTPHLLSAIVLIMAPSDALNADTPPASQGQSDRPVSDVALSINERTRKANTIV